ncbi:MAG: TRAM domain-containing protein, partial [Candidatus Brocadiae bacterium]|nr:TRAM domain-containing protein [Candidatus Brocadiia bacterium]
MIWSLRLAFAFLLAVIGRVMLQKFWVERFPGEASPWWWGALAGALFAGVFITLEKYFTRRFLGLISVVMFGVVFGFIASYLFTQSLFLLPLFSESEAWFRDWVQYCSLAIFVYLSVIGILQSKDDFKFVIPFVELQRESAGPKSVLLDTSVIIDGRIADLVDLRLITTRIILPRFVLKELQAVSDSQDKLKRNRGRRGLDILNRMQRSKSTVIEFYEGDPPGIEGVDAKLVAVAKHLDAAVMTNDFNLAKVAQLQGVQVVNLNDIAVAMRPVILPGEQMEVKIQKPGESHGQGVGYLDDGTMVVVEGGFGRIGEVVTINVTSAIQTSAGRMIFGTLKGWTEPPRAARGRGTSKPPKTKTEALRLAQQAIEVLKTPTDVLKRQTDLVGFEDVDEVLLKEAEAKKKAGPPSGRPGADLTPSRQSSLGGIRPGAEGGSTGSGLRPAVQPPRSAGS